MKEITIDGFKYQYRKNNIKLTDFDHDGICKKYEKSYIIISEDQEPRIRFLNGIFDDNNHRTAFDPLNYSEDDIMVRLNHGDECFLDELYEICYTDNKNGEVYYDYLSKMEIHKDIIELVTF